MTSGQRTTVESVRPLMRLLTHWHKPWGIRRIIGVLVVAVGIAFCTWLVLATGGIRLVFSHSMYLPILLAGAIFGAPGGVLAGIVAGVALGPAMPIDTTTGEMQDLVNWLYRLGFFTLIGGTTGGLVSTAVTLAGRDPVTGLPGAVTLHREATRWIAHLKADAHVKIYVLSLDNLAEVTQMFGLVTGASFVREFVEWLTNSVGRRRVYQVNVDTFAVIGSRDPDGALRGMLAEGMTKPVTANGLPIYVHLSIGEAVLTPQASAAMMIRQATEAAASTADSRPSPQARSRQDAVAATANLDLLSGLADGIDADQLRLNYQPIVDPAFERVHGIEALVRWQHPSEGLLAPDRFLPQTELTPLIQTLTAWVLNAALRDADALQRQGKSWQCSVNLSKPNLYDSQLVDTVQRILANYAVPAERLEIEVPAAAFVEDPRHVGATLGALRDVGVTLALDDVGQPHGSMQEFSRAPVSTIKISRSLVLGLDQLSSRRHVVESIVSGAHRLGMKVVALGVEDASVLGVARELGCDLFQGFHFSHPLPSSEIGSFAYPGSA